VVDLPLRCAGEVRNGRAKWGAPKTGSGVGGGAPDHDRRLAKTLCG